MQDWNEQQLEWIARQQQLAIWLATPGSESEALSLALRQHAQVHSAARSTDGLYSFEDEVLDGLGDEDLRRTPAGAVNSIAWLLWHCARIEDVTTTMLIADQPQVLEREPWQSRLLIAEVDVGTGMGDTQVAGVTQRIDLPALREYRQAVGDSTRQILQELTPERLHAAVSSAPIARLKACGALGPGGEELADIWGSWTISDLVRQPAIRHSFVHLIEAFELKQRMPG